MALRPIGSNVNFVCLRAYVLVGVEAIFGF